MNFSGEEDGHMRVERKGVVSLTSISWEEILKNGENKCPQNSIPNQLSFIYKHTYKGKSEIRENSIK